MQNRVLQETTLRMRKSIDAFKQEITKLRTGRAHPSILDHVRVDYYGAEVPISQIANITVSDARGLLVTPWEKKMVPLVEKAILNSDLRVNPVTSGEIIRVPLPALSEERRKELIKVVKNAAEVVRVSVRNIRRDANAECKEMQKNKAITEDEEHNLVDDIQKLTDKFIIEIDQILATKTTELMAV